PRARATAFLPRACRSAAFRFVLYRWRDDFAGPGARFSLRRRAPMRFMYIVLTEQPAAPTPALMEAMAKLADREVKAGRMIDSGGLMPGAQGAPGGIHGRELHAVDRAL